MKTIQKDGENAVMGEEEEKDQPAVGMPKSGKPWKKSRVKLDKSSSGISKTWKRKQEERKERQALREKVKQMRSEIGEKLKRAREQKEKKEERRKYNEMKSGTYQIIRNTDKLKKWGKKAKKLLTKLPPDLFYEKFGGS
uniref:Coiled-coil domain-containing protein 86 n=1 Tax=Euplotes harpa TaxID=151035 RepID=A0A7S3J732_9SPIT|mmetsp:Transcript_23639/g.27147  ORF Transcript_23639/g.27147 Transcript_23639/m.27147 type:complete len:139 (+) Transcript_23639:26-442(+)